jgi:malate/lactate dehydrogenase
VTKVKNVIIWGNHSSTQYPDVSHGTVDGKPIREALKGSEGWLAEEFVPTVQQRGAAIIKVRGAGCAGVGPRGLARARECGPARAGACARVRAALVWGAAAAYWE